MYNINPLKVQYQFIFIFQFLLGMSTKLSWSKCIGAIDHAR